MLIDHESALIHESKLQREAIANTIPAYLHDQRDQQHESELQTIIDYNNNINQ